MCVVGGLLSVFRVREACEYVCAVHWREKDKGHGPVGDLSWGEAYGEWMGFGWYVYIYHGERPRVFVFIHILCTHRGSNIQQHNTYSNVDVSTDTRISSGCSPTTHHVADGSVVVCWCWWRLDGVAALKAELKSISRRARCRPTHFLGIRIS